MEDIMNPITKPLPCSGTGLKQKSIHATFTDLTANSPDEIPHMFSLPSKSVLESSSVLQGPPALDISKSPEVDNISPILLRHTAHTICHPLHLIPNQRLREEIPSSMWKSAPTVPVFKGGHRSNVENHYPISILPTLPFE